MKLNASMIPYSGTVGGGLRLLDHDGHARFIVSVFAVGVNQGITKEETAVISSALINGIPDGIEVPDR